MKDEKKSPKESSRCLEQWPELRGRRWAWPGGQFPGVVGMFQNSEWVLLLSERMTVVTSQDCQSSFSSHSKNISSLETIR